MAGVKGAGGGAFIEWVGGFGVDGGESTGYGSGGGKAGSSIRKHDHANGGNRTTRKGPSPSSPRRMEGARTRLAHCDEITLAE